MSVATYQSTLGGGVAEDAKSSESIVASSGLIGILGKFRYDEVEVQSVRENGIGGFPGVWNRIFKCVAFAGFRSDRLTGKGLHGIMKQKNNPVRKDKSLTD